MKIDLAQIYLLESAQKRTALHVQPVFEEMIDARGLCLGTWSPSASLAWRYHMGGRPYDVITTSWAIPYLLSPRMLEVMRPFTGWSTFPVHVTGKDGKEVPGYEGLVIRGRCGPVDQKRGRELWCPHETPLGKLGPRRVFLWFDPDTWDGSDLFAPEGMSFKLITHGLMLALKRAKITNITMTPLTEA